MMYDDLTKREYFAAFAMQGLLASKAPGIRTKAAKPGADVTPKLIAKVARECADALLNELKKGKTNGKS